MLVRGDEYYMAVCNQNGTIAVYNESKNIFLSPMVDGPLKYVGDLEDEKNIVQKSRFGRDFSIVRVPYAFKLLMQELKTMNVQMRIITEDNVDKLTSLFNENLNPYQALKKEKLVEKSFDSLRDEFRNLIPQKMDDMASIEDYNERTPDSRLSKKNSQLYK